ncbi:MAG: ribonuclease H-like domain-containing protein [Nitrospirota bacterium]
MKKGLASSCSYVLKPSMLKKIVVDIETIGKDFDSFDETTREYLLKYAETEDDIKAAKEGLGFSPLTGEVAAIGMLNPDTGRGAVYYQSPEVLQEPLEEEGIEYIADTEAGILRRFWEAVRHYDQMITFNGRGFDAPFLILRSAINKIAPTKEIMPTRYNLSHCDLMDVLTFYGAVRRKFSLHMWCKAFGIKSPKEEGITGHEVPELFKQQQYLTIARYCVGDLYATKELYEYWERYVKYPPLI